MKRMSGFPVIASLAIFSLAAMPAFGQTWIEVDDAPAGVPERQDSVGTGLLTNIRGTTGAGDWVDTYSILITDPSAFYATTASTYGNGTGTSTFDTRLYLFAEDGTPMLANDDLTDGPPWQSLITPPSMFPNGVEATAAGVVLTPGKYLLAVTGWDNNPLDGKGQLLFSDTGSISSPNTSLHGPNPFGTAFTNWTNTGETGDYVVELGGATFCSVPEPNAACLAAVGLLSLLGIRYRITRSHEPG